MGTSQVFHFFIEQETTMKLKHTGLLLLTSLLAGAAHANGPTGPSDLPPPPWQGHEGPMPHMPPPDVPAVMLPCLHGVQLSDAQDDAIFELLNRNAPQMRKQHKEVEKTGKALRDQAKAESFSEARLADLAQAHAQALAKLELMRVQQERAVLAVLTPEQRRQANRNGERPAGPPQGQAPQMRD